MSNTPELSAYLKYYAYKYTLESLIDNIKTDRNYRRLSMVRFYLESQLNVINHRLATTNPADHEYRELEKALEKIGKLVLAMDIRIEDIRIGNMNRPLESANSNGGNNKYKYKGKTYKIHFGSRGGKYIVVGKDKQKIYI